MIYKQDAFNMIILMLNHSGINAFKGFCMSPSIPDQSIEYE